MKIVAVVGMSGSGKSEVARVFRRQGFACVRFGDLTDREISRRGLAMNEENERRVREELRKEHGMAAYAKLNLPTIDAAMKDSAVVVDGLYSWEEFRLLKQRYGEEFCVVAVYASPKTRQGRLPLRRVRSLSPQQSLSRDYHEIENLGKGGPIAMADFTICNESSLAELERETARLIAMLS